MPLNSLIIRQGGTLGTGSYALELDCRRAELQALYEEHSTEPRNDHFQFGQLISDYISRGGQIHYVIDADGQVVGSAYVLGSDSLLQNLWPVERFFVAKALDADQRYAIARALIESVVEAATAGAVGRPDSIWLQVFIPAGALAHPESQPVYGALESCGFRGVGINNAELWIRLIEPSTAT